MAGVSKFCMWMLSMKGLDCYSRIKWLSAGLKVGAIEYMTMLVSVNKIKLYDTEFDF